MVNRTSICLVLALFQGDAAAAADRLVQVSIADKLVEQSEVAADAVVVGLVSATGTNGLTRAVLAAIPPAARGGEVCLRVQTEDGLYTGTGTYAEPGPGQDSFALLPYETSLEAIYGYPADEVGVLVYPCGAQTPLRVALASWGADEDDVPGGEAELLVNSFRADRVFVALPDDSVADCASETEGSRAAFDFRCPIPVAVLRPGGALTIYRARGESLDAPVEVDVIGWE